MPIQIFVSTKETQGRRQNDFCHADEGEIVAFSPTTCTNEVADDNCGCARSMPGLRTHKSTTTMKVHAYDGNVSDLEYIIARFLQEGGWYKYPELLAGENHPATMARSIAENATRFSVGTVVEYRDGVFSAR